MMTDMAFWLTTKLNEKCNCGSGKAYRVCCLCRELLYFLILCIAAVALFTAASGMNATVFIEVLVTVLLVAGVFGWLIQRRLK